MFLAAQLVSILTILTSALALLSKEKYKNMLWFTVSNVSMLVTYLLLGRYLGCILVAGATIRTFIYYYYATKNRSPHPMVMIFFLIYFIAVSVLLWKDFSDIFMLVNLCMLTYTTWQNNMTTFRLGYIFSSVLLITYDCLVGAYVSIISEMILLVAAVFSIYKYNIKNGIKDIVLYFYSIIAPIFDISVTKLQNNSYYIMHSLSENDNFCNFYYLPNPHDILKEENIEKINQKKYIYFQSTSETQSFIKEQLTKYNLTYNNVWLKFRKENSNNHSKCILDNMDYKVATENEKQEIINIFNKSKNCDYNNIINKHIEKFSDDFMKIHKIFPYLAYCNSKPIACLIVYKKDANAFIYQITTLPEYQRNGVASALIKFSIEHQKAMGTENFYSIIEKLTHLELFYMKNNFEEISQGFCLDYSEIINKDN